MRAVLRLAMYAWTGMAAAWTASAVTLGITEALIVAAVCGLVAARCSYLSNVRERP